MDFNEINTCTDLVNFLHDKGLNHRKYYHYTNISCALGIIKSGYWHLSSGDRMNDKQELTKGDANRWKNIFISCFTFGENENMALWGLYGLPWEDAVRIIIPKREMNRWMSESPVLYKLPENKTREYTVLSLYDTSSLLTDVAYVNGTRHLGEGSVRWTDKTINIRDRQELIGISDDPVITGYIKNAAWSYENEVRIRVEFDNQQNLHQVAIKIPEYVINSLEIQAEPWMQFDLKTRIEKELRGTPQEVYRIQSSKSAFINLVDLKNTCSYCQYKKFQRAI